MLIKLLKYEYRATAKLLLPLFLGVLFVIMLNTVLLRVGQLIPNASDGSAYTAVTVILSILSILGFWAVLVVSFISGIQRFYTMLGTQGYLMFSLPVTANQLIASKLICSVSWMIAAILLGNVFFRMLALPANEGELVVSSSADAWLTIFCLCLSFLVMICAAFLYFYFCIALGGQWPQNRLLATVITYFGVTLAVQIVAALGMVALVFVSFAMPDISTTTSSFLVELTPEQSAALFILGITLFFFIACVILWILIRYLLTKKLNLA